MVIRLLRYISFHPWGSLRADANRRKSGIDQIINKLWGPNPFAADIGIFVAGGGVMWTPVTVQDDLIRTPDKLLMTGISNSDKLIGWLASRQPPPRRRDMEARGLVNLLWIDVTEQLTKALAERNDGGPLVVQVLFDCRFLIHFDVRKLPEGLTRRLMRHEGKVIVYSKSRFFMPEVVEERDGKMHVLHTHDSKITDDNIKSFQLDMKDSHVQDTHIEHEVGAAPEWITIKWIRPLSAI
jgi:tRNA(Ile)-lysidine synthase